MNVALAVVTVCSTVAYIQCTVCKHDTECSTGECCYIKPEFMVVSRKRDGAQPLPLQPISNHHDTGVCEKYKLEHTPCWPLEKANGHCSCGSGLSCQFVPAKLVTAKVLLPQLINARSIYMPGPGTYQCEKITS